MKVVNLYLIILTASGYLLSCSMPKIIERTKPFPTGEYQYAGYATNGDKIVEGRLSITSVEPRRINEEAFEIKGNWQLNRIDDPEKIGPQTGTGELLGSIEKGEISIDLNPNMNDNNVILRGKI